MCEGPKGHPGIMGDSWPPDPTLPPSPRRRELERLAGLKDGETDLWSKEAVRGLDALWGGLSESGMWREIVHQYHPRPGIKNPWDE
jgi:hypothetical protein